MTAPVLELDDVAVTFAGRARLFGANAPVRAVNGVSLAIAPGETVALVGESGCGKSTLANAIAGLEKTSGGRIRVCGEEVTGADRARLAEIRRNVQMIFQDPALSLDPRATIGATVGEPLKVRGIARGRALAEQVGALLNQVGLRPEHADRYPHQFSGGQRQRVVIARALALEPRLVICDEPVSALDVSVRAQILNLLVELQARTQVAYLFVSHDLSVVRHICDRVVVMYLGRFVEIADRETFFADPTHPYARALMSAVPVADPVAQRSRQRFVLTGELPSPTNVPPGCAFHTRCPMATEICSRERPELVRRQNGAARRLPQRLKGSLMEARRWPCPACGRPAEIVVDRWGIPHISAGNEADLFFVQGFNAARDRLWQIDLWRKRGLGLLAADFGPGYLAQDHAARHFLYRGDMAAEWARLCARHARRSATAFAAGINAYVDLCEAEPARMPPEFALFGTRPAHWRPRMWCASAPMRSPATDFRRFCAPSSRRRPGPRPTCCDRRSIRRSRSPMPTPRR